MTRPVNRYKQKFGQAAIQRRLMGVVDPRGPVGIMSRGQNVYRGTSYAAHHGGGSQYGRPRGTTSMTARAAALRRLRGRRV